MQKIKDYALALAAMVAGVTMGYGWGAEWNDDGDGNQSYTEETQERFNQYYSLIMEALDNAKN